jgi:hypothetical protein
MTKTARYEKREERQREEAKDWRDGESFPHLF